MSLQMGLASAGRFMSSVIVNPVGAAAGVASRVMYEPSSAGGIDVGDIIDGASGSIESGGAFADVTSTVDNVGGGAYHIVFRVIVFVFLIGLMIAGVALFFSNSANRSEQKSNIIWKVVGVIIAFGAISILVFFSTASANIFSAG